MWWLLAREVLRLKGSISRDIPWDVVPDLFFYRDPEEVGRFLKKAHFNNFPQFDQVEKEEQTKAEQQENLLHQDGWGGTEVTTVDDQWNDAGITTTVTTGLFYT